MALAHVLDTQGIHPDALNVTATCDLEVGPEGPRIAAIELEVHGRIPGLDASAFEEAAAAPRRPARSRTPCGAS